MKTTTLLRICALALFAAACDPVVGGDCALTATPCGDVCCGPASRCIEDGVCEAIPDLDAGPADADPRPSPDGATDSGPSDGGLPDGTVPDGSQADGSSNGSDGAVADGSVGDGGSNADGSTNSDGGSQDPDGGPDAGADGGNPPSDGGVADGGGIADGGTDGGTTDGGPIVCPLGTQLCDNVCVDTDSDPDNCGACNTTCGVNEICVLGTCLINCPPPRVVCNNACVDIQTDPDYCGTCGTVCSSGICFAGSCVAASAGHIVLIGHDFTSPQPGVGRLVGNAALIPTGNPVRIGTFAERTSPAVQAAVDAALGTTAAELGRTYQLISTTETNVTQRLATVDTFLIYPQDLASDGELNNWGLLWQLALDAFVRSGGTIVVVDAGGAHAGTWQILDAAGLFAVQSRNALPTGTTLSVSNAADSVALNVPLTFPAPANSVTFTTGATEVVVETSSAAPDPVVFHRVVRP